MGSFRDDPDVSTAALSAPARARRLLAFSATGHASFELPERGTVVIGRGRDATVRIEHESVSRTHAALHVGPPITIEDMGSANGTKLSGRGLTPRRPEAVGPGAIIEMGAVRLVLGVEPAAAGSFDPMVPLRDVVERVAPSDLSIIIGGETGAGKEVLAEEIHRRSKRSSGPLLRLDCAALAEQLLEGELFGYERGAFTGAVRTKPGLLEMAQGGTVLLDEAGEMPMTTQAKLLGVLERREVLRLGALRPQAVDVRFLVATHRDLDLLVVQGRFRQDLHFRLNGITIRVPPLRERRGEIVPLARELLAASALRAAKGKLSLTPNAELLLENYSWPGNVRELRQVLDRAALLCDRGRIEVEQLVFGRTGPGTHDAPRDLEAEKTLDTAEARRIAAALERCGGNQKEAAKVLGISRRTLANRLDRLGMARPRKGVRGDDP